MSMLSPANIVKLRMLKTSIIRPSRQPKSACPRTPDIDITMKMPLFPLFSGISGAVPTLDLHGMRVRPALDATRDFLMENHAGGAEQVRIIYGKGRGTPGGLGVLRQVEGVRERVRGREAFTDIGKVEDGKLNHGRTLTGILDNTSRMRQEMSGDVHRNKVFG